MATTLVSVGEYLHTSYEPDADYVDGVIEERSVGEFDHSSWQDALLAWFRRHGAARNMRARPELRVQVAPARFRIPDVTVIDCSLPPEQILTRPPVAVFEVLSPEDQMSRVLVKLEDYARMGVRSIFVINPQVKRFYRYEVGSLELCGGAPEPLTGTTGFVDWERIEELLND